MAHDQFSLQIVHWIEHNIHSVIAGALLKKIFVLSERNDRINQIDINLYHLSNKKKKKNHHHNNNKKKETNNEEKGNRNGGQYANAD